MKAAIYTGKENMEIREVPTSHYGGRRIWTRNRVPYCSSWKNVKDFKLQERVYPYPCYVKNDTKRVGTIGGFSEYILVLQAKRNYLLYTVSDKIPD